MCFAFAFTNFNRLYERKTLSGNGAWNNMDMHVSIAE